MTFVKKYDGKVFATFIKVGPADLKTIMDLKKHGWELAKQAA